MIPACGRCIEVHGEEAAGGCEREWHRRMPGRRHAAPRGAGGGLELLSLSIGFQTG
ncbi:hypothetical protein ppKF707_0256 [Metapseudomonas furukawaii]|uniref:Uncharacterized protein n=1 Tax=Metapseudomonas furukawaii TaxID=1149133 RepID=A0AAD1FE19_METFU|nr:hypothetical protein ppKF707_0256 [Pseudomonas furukawaii]BAU72507.1 hypothetical protein KF707C_8190 [Pseudomonas furukawaii]